MPDPCPNIIWAVRAALCTSAAAPTSGLPIMLVGHKTTSRKIRLGSTIRRESRQGARAAARTLLGGELPSAGEVRLGLHQGRCDSTPTLAMRGGFFIVLAGLAADRELVPADTQTA